MIDPETGNPIGDTPGLIQISRNFLKARPTDVISYTANLPSYPKTAVANTGVADSELLKASDLGTADLSAVPANQETAFLDRSLSGGAVTAYDTLGQPVSVQLRWAKTDNKAGGGDQWQLFYKSDDSATGAATKWTNVGQTYNFTDGQLTPKVNSVTVSGMTINGVNLGDVTIDHGASNITQFDDTNGTVSVTNLDQTGYPSGSLVGIAVGDNSRITGTYSNGKTVDLAQVSLANFGNANALNKVDGTAFEATQESGEAFLTNSAEVVGSSLEASNVDLADEFAKLITTQQAYTAGSRIITAVDQLTQETLNMKR